MSMRIEVEGVGTVEVDPSFAELSPEEQNGVIEEIRQSASSGRASSDAVAPSSMSINAGRQDFDLGAEMNRAQPQQTSTPTQGEPPQQFGFNFEQSQPLLLRFVNQLEARDRKIKAAKFGDAAVPGTKGNIESSFEQVFNQEFAPAFQQVGLDPEVVQEFGRIKQADPKLTIPEALQRAGVALPASGAPTALNPEAVEMLRGKQQARDAEYAAAENAPDEVTKGRHLERAMQIDSEIDKMRGVAEMPFQDKETELDIAKNDLANLELRKDGTINWRGQNVGYEERQALAADIQRREATLDLEAMRNPAVLPLNRRTPGLLAVDGINEAGEPIINQAKTSENLAKMTASLVEQGKLRVGQRYQDPLTGGIVRFGGLGQPGQEDERSLFELATPKRLQPAIKGAGVVAGRVAEAVTPMLTEENVAMAANAVLPVVGYGSVKTTAAAMRNPQEAVAKLGRAAVTGGIPGGILAMKGLDYLSEIGRKAEEEEKKKKLAGQ